MRSLLFVVMLPRAMKFWFGCKVVGLAVIVCSLVFALLWAMENGKFAAAYVAMKRLLLLLKGYLLTVLGAYDPVAVNHLIYRSALLSQQASSGKYSPGMKHVVLGQIGYVQQAICALDKTYAEQFRCKPRLRKVEIVNGSGEGMELTGTDTTDGKICDSHLLAAPAGPQG